ncbi:putative UAA transporter family [Monocercomonoides exilis]|uniref:putative UAA transporter family n=1 Tax=Monocercomonoides exilis TaxID=2049356 RepID=UPI00355A2628|nr:putative UAA transporter family [Monocercomonoides exilis]
MRSPRNIFSFIFHSIVALCISVTYSYFFERFLSRCKGKKIFLNVFLLPFVNNIVSCIIYGFSMITLRKNRKFTLSSEELKHAFLSGFYESSSTLFSHYSLQYISYPLKIIFSSAKILFAIPASIIITTFQSSGNSKKSFKKYEIIISFVMFIGLVVVLLPIGSAPGLLENFSIKGASLIFVSINLGCFYDQHQMLLLRSLQSTPVALFWNSLFALCCTSILIITLGDIKQVISTLTNLQELVPIIIISCHHTLSQFFLASLKRKYGIFWKNVVASLRRCISLIISIVLFGHSVTIQQACGITIVLTCVFLAGNAETKNRNREK